VLWVPFFRSSIRVVSRLMATLSSSSAIRSTERSPAAAPPVDHGKKNLIITSWNISVLSYTRVVVAFDVVTVT
jgi:hypothetical protein